MQYLHGRSRKRQADRRITVNLNSAGACAIPGIEQSCYCHGAAIGNGQIQEEPRVCSVARSGACEHPRRQAKTERYQQTRKQIPAQTLRAKSAPVLLQKTKQTPVRVCGWLISHHVSALKCNSGISKQDGAHGLSGSVQKRSLSPAIITTSDRSLMALHMTPGTSAKLGNR